MQPMITNIRRLISLPEEGTETFFLWGMRQTGKSSLLRACYPNSRWIDLLRTESFRHYSTYPERLREELESSGDRFVVIDEIQKVPALLDEVHWLHENKGVHFALCGSSARKLKRGHSNMLGGRAIRYELFGFSAYELGASFDLDRMLNHGSLPRLYQTEHPQRLWDAYVSDYLKEEIMAEGLVRNLPPFSRFLDAAALGDTEQVNFTNIAQELGVSRESVRGYYEILADTLVGRFLSPYRKRPKRRLSVAEKFYFCDLGTVNFLAKRGNIVRGSELYGKAFENWVFHELCCYNSYRNRYATFGFWRLSTGVEVDFIINDLECAIEAKATPNILDRHLKGLREIANEHPKIGRRLIVGLETKSRRTSDGVDILSVPAFLDALWSGQLF
jgi:uncharacterized protein